MDPVPNHEDDHRQDDEQEIPTTKLWRAAMRERRMALGMSQAAIGRSVGVSQAMVSAIERGDSGSSSVVYAISKLLGISPPIVGLDPDVEKIVSAALTLKLRSPARYAALLIMVDSMLGAVSDEEKRSH